MQLRSGVTKESDQDMATEKLTNGNDWEAKPHDHNVHVAGRPFNRVLLATHLNIFLYSTCFWIQIGTIPYLSKKLGVDPVMFGYLQTTFAVVQLCGGPLFGRFGDLFGGRAALTLAFASAALAYGLLGMAVTVPLLFLSRLPSVFMHAMQGGQMVVTDMSEPGQRADALGKLGLSYGIGMVVGPFIGGIITKNLGEYFAAWLACGGSVLSAALCMILIPAQTKKHTVTADKSGAAVFSLHKLALLLTNPKAFGLLLVKAVSGVPIGIFQSMFAIVAMNTFKLAPDQNGYIMSYVGIITMIVQGVGIGILTRRFSEGALIKAGAFILIWAYLLLAFIANVWQLCVVLIPLCVGLTLMNVVISSALTNTVPESDTGAMLGVNMAVNSLIRTVSPTVGGYMLNAFGFPSFGYLGFINSILVTLYLAMHMKG